jgi:disulfide bond formation protein DsbB
MKRMYAYHAATNLLVVLGAILIQWYYSLLACPMCYYQRYAYVAAALVSLMGWRFQHKSLLWVLRLMYVTALCLAITQVLAETGLIAPPSFCSGVDVSGIQDLQTFKETILNNQDTPCNNNVLKFMGLSFASYSLIFAAFMTLATYTHSKY